MSTFKYNGTDPLEIGGDIQIRISEGQTFEVPEQFAAQFEADDRFSASRTKSPDVTTGPILVQGAPDQVPAQPTA